MPTCSARACTSKIAEFRSDRSSGAHASGSTWGPSILGARGCRRIRLFPEELVRAAIDVRLDLAHVLPHDSAEADDRLSGFGGLLADRLEYLLAAVKPRPPERLQPGRRARDSKGRVVSQPLGT